TKGQGGDINLGMFAFTPDPLTNSIVVTGNPMTFLVIQKVLDAVDVEPSTLTKPEVRSYVLNPNVSASQVATNIQQLFAGRAQDRSGIPPASVTSEANTNLVLVTATDPQHKEIFEKIIKPILDQATAGAQRVTKIIEIANSDARDVAKVLTSLFSQRQASRPGVQPVSINAMEGANKLAVNCTDTEFKEISQLITQIEEGAGGSRTAHVVEMPPEVRARTVADSIAKMYAGQGVGGGQGVKAEANDPTNTVLVFATEAEFEKINRDVIDKLRKVKPVGT